MQDNAIQTTRIHPAFVPLTGLKCSYGKIELRQPALSHEHIKNFTKDFKSNRGKARSWKPGQLGQPGLCKEVNSQFGVSLHDIILQKMKDCRPYSPLIPVLQATKCSQTLQELPFISRRLSNAI